MDPPSKYWRSNNKKKSNSLTDNAIHDRKIKLDSRLKPLINPIRPVVNNKYQRMQHTFSKHANIETNTPISFTLDAGANVHLLYPANESDKVITFIKSELLDYCQSGQFIQDRVGQGAKKM